MPPFAGLVPLRPEGLAKKVSSSREMITLEGHHTQAHSEERTAKGTGSLRYGRAQQIGDPRLRCTEDLWPSI